MTAMDEHNIKSVATTHWPVCVKERGRAETCRLLQNHTHNHLIALHHKASHTNEQEQEQQS